MPLFQLHDLETDKAEHSLVVCGIAGEALMTVRSNGDILHVPTTQLWGSASSGRSGSNFPIGFAGQYHDEETGLNYNVHRYYDPISAGYVSTDPIGLRGGMHSRAYVHNPVVWSDPLGLMSCETDESGDATGEPSGGRAAQERGLAYEDRLVQELGGSGSFSTGGRQFDGAFTPEGASRETWYEAKSGEFWQMLDNNPKAQAKFFSNEGQKLQIATANNADYMVVSERPIPAHYADWLTKKGIPFRIVP
ncbi:RHS repeat-associated core domain-containing protein [Yinghuangia sp. YIM S10712]|uniref:RHS repeat-associated core domain-containing protein n=1 Tax=Yinghuangia sp. YIM S10712 TaxID=3436930 RepID=UPI003F53E12A